MDLLVTGITLSSCFLFGGDVLVDLLVTGITLSSCFVWWRCFSGPTGNWDHTE